MLKRSVDARCTGPLMFHVGLKPQRNTTQEPFGVSDSSGSLAEACIQYKGSISVKIAQGHRHADRWSFFSAA